MGVLQVRLLCKWIPYVQLVCYLWDRDWKRKLLFPLFGPLTDYGLWTLRKSPPRGKKGQQLWQIIFPFLVHALFLGHPWLSEDCAFSVTVFISMYLLNQKINAWWPLKIESPKKARPALKTNNKLSFVGKSIAFFHGVLRSNWWVLPMPLGMSAFNEMFRNKEQEKIVGTERRRKGGVNSCLREPIHIKSGIIFSMIMHWCWAAKKFWARPPSRDPRSRRSKAMLA